jgi:hypothetical protein
VGPHIQIQIGADGSVPDRIEGNTTTQKGTIGFFTMTRTDD